MSYEDIKNRILELKEKRNAVILVHAYQPAEIQDIADFVGDSLLLSEIASKTYADTIVFCGVRFMAETASILSPDKHVLLPELDSNCPMASMITPQKLREVKKKYPDYTVVTYVNTTADIKAESDVCCTSANALKVVSNIENNKIIFTPDKYLGSYIQSKLKDKEIVLYDGYCPVHVKILAEHVISLKQKYPEALVLAHPECLKEVVNLGSEVLSTTGMFNFIKKSSNKEFIIATEIGIVHWLRVNNPDKEIYGATDAAVCVNMKKNSLEKVLNVLENMNNRIEVKKDIRDKALLSISKMLEYTRED